MLKDALIDCDAATGRMRSLPQQIFLELSERCNLACVHCSKDYGRPAPDQERDLPWRALERLQPWLHAARFVNLNIVGESLLAPHFDAAVELCTAGGAEVSFNTNGLLFTPQRCALFVERGVHSIAMSFDGMQSNSRVRGVGYELLRSKLALLLDARTRLGRTLPHVSLAYTLMRHNVGELVPLLEDLLPRGRIHAVHVQPLVVFYESMRGENVYAAEAVDESVERARTVCARHGTELVLFRSRFVQDERSRPLEELVRELGPYSERYGCTDPFFEIKVRADGSVMSCSYGRMCGANVLEHELDEIWNSAWYRELRLKLYAGIYEGRCQGCPCRFGSASNQLDALRPGVDHSRAARFHAGNR